MRHKRLKTFLPAFLLLSVLFCSCKDGDDPEDKPVIQVEQTYAKIQEHGMILKIISTRSSFLLKDYNKTVKFQFINEGLSRVLLSEWKTVEQDNMKIQYAECPVEGGADKLPESAWKDAPRTTVQDCPRYPLELDPKSSVIITLPLSFIKELKKPGRYAIRGVMDLRSMDVKSAPLELIIR